MSDDHEKRAMSEDEIEAMAWELETKIMAIRKPIKLTEAQMTAALAASAPLPANRRRALHSLVLVLD